MLSLCVCLPVCLSVCLSVASLHCLNIAKHRITQTMPYDSPGSLFFGDKYFGEISMGSSPMGVPNAGEVGKKW